MAWYGGSPWASGAREVGLVSGAGGWYESGRGLVPVRWVFVRDRTGTHRDEHLFSTDPARDPAWVVGRYCGRWNIETTFQEARSCLGLGTTRGWGERAVPRAAPCLFGLCSAVAALYEGLPGAKRSGRVEWPGKGPATFSDALTAVRRWLWSEAVLTQAGGNGAMQNLPEPVRELLLATLAPAA